MPIVKITGPELANTSLESMHSVKVIVWAMKMTLSQTNGWICPMNRAKSRDGRKDFLVAVLCMGRLAA